MGDVRLGESQEAEGSAFSRYHNRVFSQLTIQGASGNAQCLCSLVFVALGLLEHLEDKVSLGVLKGGGICLGPGKGVFDVLGEITCFDHLPFGQDHRMPYDILELPKGVKGDVGSKTICQQNI